MANLKKNFKETLANALSKAFWDNLVDYLKTDAPHFPMKRGRHPITDAEVTDQIGKILGLDAYTVGRWFKGSNFVHPNKFFLVVICMRIGLSDVKFDERRDLIRKAVRLMVERIERVYLKGGRSGPFDERRLECIRLLYDHPLSQYLLVRSPDPKVRLKRAMIFRDVTLRLKQEAASKDWDEKGVGQISDAWFHAYDLYMTHRPLEWEFLREI